MTKMQLTQRAAGAVYISYDDADDECPRIEREFFVRGRHVYEDMGQGRDAREVCERLQCRGNTLMSDAQSLADVIRREYRAMRRAELRDAKRY